MAIQTMLGHGQDARGTSQLEGHGNNDKEFDSPAALKKKDWEK
jgi:hypothetical protein